MMDRRAFIIGLAGALAAPVLVQAQEVAKKWRIGVLSGHPTSNALWRAFQDSLHQLGYIKGRCATELVATGVDILVVGGANVQAQAAKNATSTIPIVMLGPVQVVETGLVKSLVRPGGNITGQTWDVSTEEAGKRLQLFKQLVPTLSRLANIWDPSQPGVSAYWPDLERSARALGIKAESVPVTDASELGSALAKLARDRPGGVFPWGGPKYFALRQTICDWALKAAIPTLTLAEQYVEAGCLMSYAPNLMHLYRGMAGYVDKILRGANPAELPIARPTKFTLAINARTARSLGLTIPTSLLLSADQVIE
jgi:ABC-type uncharacterized transport system substrate-binding protein